MDRGTPEEAEVLAPGFVRAADVRLAQTIEVTVEILGLVEARLEACREEVARHFGCRLTGHEGAGFVRYPAGGFYRPHIDCSDSPSWAGAARRAVAAVVFLNSASEADPAAEFRGGVLRLFPTGQTSSAIDVVPRRGTLVAFPATRVHEVTLVDGGVRDAVVDWYYR